MAEHAAPAATNASDWPAEAADRIESVVGTVRDATTGKALTVAKAIVYGTFAAIVGITVLVMLSVGLVRFADIWIPGEVWSAHLAIGAAFSFGGLILMRMARRKLRPEYPTGV